MPISSYQVEWLIHQRRRWRGLVEMVERALVASPEKVELSKEGRRLALEQRAQSSPKAAGERIWPLDHADRTVHPDAVDYELERRAGSFMQPKVLPSKPYRAIPRVDLWEAADQDDSESDG